jgi:hypothetical protein
MLSSVAVKISSNMPRLKAAASAPALILLGVKRFREVISDDS